MLPSPIFYAVKLLANQKEVHIHKDLLMDMSCIAIQAKGMPWFLST